MLKFRPTALQDFQVPINSDYRIPNPLPDGLTVDEKPIDFGSVKNVVMACEETAPLFDYTFLLRLLIRGSDAIRRVFQIFSRDFSDLPIGGIRHGLIIDPDRWLVSDLTVWRSNLDVLKIMSGWAEDVSFIKTALAGHDVKTLDLSQQTAVLTLQGPETNKILSKIPDKINIEDIPYFLFRDLEVCSVNCRVGRLAYTGLDGVEILNAANQATRLWKLPSFHAHPAEFSTVNCLRLKAGIALFTHEFKPPVIAANVGLKRMRQHGKLCQLNPTKVCRRAYAVLQTLTRRKRPT